MRHRPRDLEGRQQRPRPAVLNDGLFIARPTFTGLVDAGFWACRSYAVVLLPASLVYDGVGALLVEILLPIDDPTLAPLRFANSILLTGFLGFLGSYAIAAGLIRIAVGDRPSPIDVLAAPWREARWALPVGFLFSFITLVGFLLGVLPAIFAEILLLVAGPVAAIEHRGAGETLRRAWKLVEGHRGRAAGIYAFVILGVLATSLPLSAMEAPNAVPALAMASCLQAVVAYFGDVVIFLFYADLRVRKESFDLELLAQSVENDEGDAPGGSS